jgi:hypothetical protein
MTGTPSIPPPAGPPGPGSPPGWGPLPPLPPPGQQPSGGRLWLTHAATAVAALLFGAVIGSAAASDSEKETAGSARPTVTATATATVTVTRTPEPAPPKPAVTVTRRVTVTPEPAEDPGPPAAMGGDGQYLVGEDVRPGTYRTLGAAESVFPNCYWARLSNASGEFSAIIANGNVKGQTRVTVRKGEYFESTGCREWKRVG